MRERSVPLAQTVHRNLAITGRLSREDVLDRLVRLALLVLLGTVTLLWLVLLMQVPLAVLAG